MQRLLPLLQLLTPSVISSWSISLFRCYYHFNNFYFLYLFNFYYYLRSIDEFRLINCSRFALSFTTLFLILLHSFSFLFSFTFIYLFTMLIILLLLFIFTFYKLITNNYLIFFSLILLLWFKWCLLFEITITTKLKFDAVVGKDVKKEKNIVIPIHFRNR